MRESLKVPARIWRAVFESFLGTDFAARLSGIAVPTLIVWGERDTICLHEEQQVLAAVIHDAKLVSYAKAGHAAHWEEPERFAADLWDFVRSVARKVIVQGCAADARPVRLPDRDPVLDRRAEVARSI